MAGLVFCKGICTLVSGNSGMIFYFIKDGVGLRVSDLLERILRRYPWTWCFSGYNCLLPYLME